MSTSPSSKRQPEIKLYWLEKSRSQRIVWLLEELNLDYSIEIYKRTSRKLAPSSLKDIHPLGKAPVVSITPLEEGASPIILAESGAMVEYLTEYFGPGLAPSKFPKQEEQQQQALQGGTVARPELVGRETESWRRYKFFLHYAEGSIMILMVVSLIMNIIRNSSPFFARPFTSAVAGRVESGYLDPNFATHCAFIEDQLATAPDGGPFLCGKELSGADIMMSFPLEGALSGRAEVKEEQYPRIYAYVEALHNRPAYKRAVDRIIEQDGKYEAAAL